MTDISWAKAVDGAFGDAAYWTGGVVPGAQDDAILNAEGGDFTVTSAGAVTVGGLQASNTAALDVMAGDFTMLGGSGSGVDAGVIQVAVGAELTNDGVLTATGTIDLDGKIDNVGTIDLEGNGEAQPSNANFIVGSKGAVLTGGGTLNLDDSYLGSVVAARLVNVDDTIAGSQDDDAGGYLGYGDLYIVNEAKGVIEATGAFGLVLAADTTNDGLIEATEIGLPGGGLVIASGGGGGTINSTGGGTILAAGSTIYLSGAVLQGGTIETNSAGEIAVGDAELDGQKSPVFNTGEIYVGGGATLDLIGTIDNSGSMTGQGELRLESGRTSFEIGTSLTVDEVTESVATAAAAFETPHLILANTWTQTAGAIEVGSGDRVTFTGTGNVFSGAITGAGSVHFSAGTDLLDRATLAATGAISGSATVTFSGLVDLSSTLAVTSPDVLIATTGASLVGHGVISLSDLATNVIKGASASARLTNSDTIKGAGQLGDGMLALFNSAEGVIHANEATALIIDLGANPVRNAGLIETTSTGGLTIDGALSSSGMLEVTAGTLAVDGKVTGLGAVKISGGTADFAAAFSQNVTFTSAGGVLELAAATRYGGDITGFSKTGASALDLTDVDFTGAAVSYSGTSASGVLTVTNGSEVATIKLEGNYTASTFSLASDGHSGTLVTAAAAAANASAITPLVSAMAAFGTPAPAGSTPIPQASPPALSTLAAPTSTGA